MTSILLKDHEAFLVHDEWNGDEKRYSYDEKKVDSLIPYLTLPLQISRNFTFQDLVKYLEQNLSLYNVIFGGALGFFDLEMFIKDAKKPLDPIKQAKDKYPLHTLVVSWRAELKEGQDAYFSLYGHFHGIGPAEDEVTKKIEETTFSLSFTPLNTLMDCLLSINEDLIIYHRTNDEILPKAITAGKYGFSVFDFLNTIFDDVSFYGAPSERDGELNTLEEEIKILDEAKQFLDDEGNDTRTGKKLLHDWEDLETAMEEEGIKEDEEHKKAAPELINTYTTLLEGHKDVENLQVKKFYKEHRNNEYFSEEATKLNAKYL